MGMFLKDINLKGKTALITGATKGLGRGAAIAIAEAGGDIIAIGRNQLELNTLKKEIKKFKVNFIRIIKFINKFVCIINCNSNSTHGISKFCKIRIF